MRAVRRWLTDRLIDLSLWLDIDLAESIAKAFRYPSDAAYALAKWISPDKEAFRPGPFPSGLQNALQDGFLERSFEAYLADESSPSTRETANIENRYYGRSEV